ncbi:MAG: arginase [Chloroflexi bacterium]|nr:arginase [Chloroflexota bacterium]
MQIDLIGVPLDFGAGRRGVDMGPSALRYAGLKSALQSIGHTVADGGNVEVPILETCVVTEPKLRYVDCIVPVARQLAERVAASVQSGNLPLTLGGDHSLSLGSVRGAARDKRLGLIWIDAHGDFNTAETTPSGNIHGMSLAALAGYGDSRLAALGDGSGPTIAPSNIAIVGVRDLDPGERDLLQHSGAAVFGMEQIDRVGLHNVLSHAIDVASGGVDGIYLSLDLDALDPVYAPGVGTPVSGGLTYREAHMACEMIAETRRLVGMDLVEVNPILDDRNKTAELAVELALSALGKRVWHG